MNSDSVKIENSISENLKNEQTDNGKKIPD